MKRLTPADLDPTVRIANYHVLGPMRCWGPRTIPDFELILIVEGLFAYETADAVLQLEPGYVLCIPPGEEHVFRCLDTAPATISCIHGELAQSGSWLSGDYRCSPAPQRVTDMRHHEHMDSLFQRCSATFHGYSRYRPLMLGTIAREIWLLLAETWKGRPEDRVSVRVEQMVQFLRDHLYEPVSRQNLADAFGITPEHVNALFKKELGTSPTQFVNRERMLVAYHLLHDEGLSVKETAARLGFCDSFYFSKLFKRIMCIPPSRI